MDKVRLILTLITIAIVVIPIVGMLLAYQGNLLGLFVPPEITEIGNDLLGDGGDDGSMLEPPQMVGEPEYDPVTGTFSVTFEYKNSFPMDITVNSLSGNLRCAEHGFPLGVASLSAPVSIDQGETGLLTIVGSWTDAAMSHFENDHEGEPNVAVVLADLAVDISGVQLQMGELPMEQGMEVPNPAYQG